METINIHAPKSISKSALWTGRIIGWIVTLFLLFDAIVKIIRAAVAVEATRQLGYSVDIVQPLGIVLFIITILYVIPRTAVFGALFLTAYLGGAVATMVHVNQSVVFPIVFCMLAWTSLFLRDRKLRTIIPLRVEE